MRYMKPFKIMVGLLIIAGSLLGACAGQPTRQELPVLKIALIPVLDTLPVHIAQKQGLFEKHGVKVELIPVGSAPERDQLISAAQADGMVNEVLSTLFYNKDEIKVVTVRYARAATEKIPLFRILTAKNSGILSPNDLKGVEIGISEGTIIEYLTDRLLEKAGIPAEEIKTVPVPKIDVRLSLLSSGELKAAMLPEPFATLAIQQNAVAVIDDTLLPELSFSTITFRKEVVDKNPQAVQGFLAAIEEAVSAINANPDQWNSLMTELKLVPAPIAGSFSVPPFITAGVPTEQQWNDVVAWAKAKGLLNKDVSYQESVKANLLP